MEEKRDYFVGLDLGQSKDYTAIAIVERITAMIGRMTPPRVHEFVKSDTPARFECSFLERVPLGTLYPAIVERVSILMCDLKDKGETRLVIDATGARAAADSFRDAGLHFIGAQIHGGDTVTHEGNYTRIPKRDLVNNLQVLLHQKRLEFTKDLPHSHTVAQEALNFQMKINDKANDSYGAWREGTHDDLLFAVMLAAWRANRPEAPPAPKSTVQHTWLPGR